MSSKCLAEKLLIKPETAVWTSHPEHLNLIEPLPAGVRVVDRPEQATVALVFGDDAESIRTSVAANAKRLADFPDTVAALIARAEL